MIELQKPLIAPITQRFGEHPEWYSKYGYAGHNGIDFGTPEGTPVKASAGGVVDYAGLDKTGYGYYVRLKHNSGEYLTYYAHLLAPAIEAGETVRQGDVIAYSDNTGNSTGPHLHWELRIIGRLNPGYKNCFDPLLYLGAQLPPGEPPAPPAISIPTLALGDLRLRVIVAGLNVRSGPGTGYPIVGKLTEGDEITAEAIGSKGEVCVKFAEGWAAVLYNGDAYMESSKYCTIRTQP